MDVGPIVLRATGLWQTSVWPGHADELLSALDPSAPYVLIETWDGGHEWHRAAVSVDPQEAPRERWVRHHSFDVLVDPEEAVAIGRLLRTRGIADGALGCFQFRRRPSATFHLPDRPHDRAQAMRGQEVEMAIQLPHDAEVAVVTSPREDALTRYVARLGELV